MHGTLPSKEELNKLQPKQLKKLAGQLDQSIKNREAENANYGDGNGGMYGRDLRIDKEREVLGYICELLEDIGW